MSRIQQDQFVDDEEEECCPLCVEEFDLSDKNFRPCPCGYQICQFCFNNIKTTMNGLCPACRRPYSESTIEFKGITPEELAKYKQQIAQKAKKHAALRQKEAQKAEADSLSRKHLAGLRVVQKNLVYVTGLTPTIREDRLLETLRGNDYFGQYGKIIKIVVSKAKENAQHQQSVGVYVTFARKEDAAACIAAVDGSQNGDRTLRAQYGTTKYCSAYLRGEQCNNRNCMFLHEPGEENDSFTRQDLSSMNVISTQQPAQAYAPHSAAQPLQPQPPPQRGPAVAAAAAPMTRQDSNDAHSPTHSGPDVPALPATANWGSKATQGRRSSRSTNASTSSPMVTNAVPVTQATEPTKVEPEPPKKKGKDKEKPSKPAAPQRAAPQPAPAARPETPRVPYFDSIVKTILSPDFKFSFSSAGLSAEELDAIMNFPQLLDPSLAAKRRVVKDKEKELVRQREAEAQAQAEVQASLQAASTTEREETIETPGGGSLQLGGEPEERHEVGLGHGAQHAIAPPGQPFLSGQASGLGEDFGGINGRGLTTQQQQLLLSSFKSATPQSAGLLSNFQSTQGQQNHGQTGNIPGHARNASRFSFANDSSSASASVQPVANQKLMNQQSSMMPKHTSQFNQLSQHQPMAGQFYTSGVQGPPPGLKATGTPPVSGGGMFGQGHGFATGGLGYGANAAASRNTTDLYDMMRNGARVTEPKLDVSDPSILQARLHQGGNMVGQGLYAGQGQDDQDFNPMEASLDVDALVNDLESDTAVSRTPVGGHILEYPRRSTPTIPPGFSAPATPRLLSEQLLRPLSRNASGITPAVPVIPVTPIRAPSPVKAKKDKAGADASNTQGSITSASADAAKTTDVGEPQAAASGKSSVAKTQQETPKKVEEKAVLNQKEIKSVSVSGAEASKSTVKPTVKTATPVKKTQNTATTDSAPPKENISITTPSVTSSKRQPPGKLDIAAAMRPSENEDPSTASSIKNELQPKNPRAISLASASSIPSSPALPSTGSPVKRSAPRTIRVVPTPKSENTPSLASAAASPLPQLPTVDKLRSRQASIASLNQPGTPVSEFLSDNASITSASISRASSPPIGGKVGTAPIRKKSKAQAKKERQERARQIAEEQAMAIEELVKSSDPEPVQAPIIGRKKKTKKPAASTPKIASPAVRSQPEPVSPKGTNQEDIENAEAKSAAASSSKNAQVTQVASSAPQNSLPSTDTKAPQALAEISKDKLQPTAQSIIADLQKTGELLSSTLEFFKPLSSSLAHATRASASASGHPSGDGKGDSRTLITPQGRFLWGLTKELEERALELERSIEECKGAARFRPKNLIPQTSPTKSKLKSKTTGQIQNQGDFTDMANFLLDQNEKFNAAMTESLNQASSSQNPNSKLDPTASLLSSASIPLPPVTSNVQMNARNLPALDLSRPIDPSKPLDVQKLPPVSSASPAVDPTVYLNHFVVPRTDSPSPNHTRQETDAIGGPPPSKPSLTANQISKATKAVADGGIMTQELENLGLMAADMLGGVVANSLEALVGAGLDPQQFQAALKNSGAGATLQNFDLATILGQVHAAAGGAGVGKRNVLGVEEAEQAMLTARKETEVLEKKLSALVKRNRRLVSGAGGGKA